MTNFIHTNPFKSKLWIKLVDKQLNIKIKFI